MAEHLWALAANHRLLVREMELRAAESTARERDHLRLQESETMLRKLFDANLDSMALSSTSDGTYIDVNQEFVRRTGFSREESIGHHFSELNMWIHPDEMIAFFDQLTKTDEVRNLEVAFRMKDRSERPMLLSGAIVEVYGRLCCLTISREISDLKMTQRELVAAREQALAASRAKTEFLSSMSHEIRTPMNAILGMADLLMETDLGDEQRRYLGTVISNGNALLALINSILDLAKVESGRISLEAVEFNLKDVTEKVLETLATRAHEKGLELMVRFAPEVPEFALGDPMRLGQILINLVGNAIKFTANGQVLVAVERDPDSAAAGALKFTVTDTGIGIPADKLHLLFHAFSQADSSTSRQYGGSGLGLAIVSRLVALMHGAVDSCERARHWQCILIHRTVRECNHAGAVDNARRSCRIRRRRNFARRRQRRLPVDRRGTAQSARRGCNGSGDGCGSDGGNKPRCAARTAFPGSRDRRRDAGEWRARARATNCRRRFDAAADRHDARQHRPDRQGWASACSWSAQLYRQTGPARRIVRRDRARSRGRARRTARGQSCAEPCRRRHFSIGRSRFSWPTIRRITAR